MNKHQTFILPKPPPTNRGSAAAHQDGNEALVELVWKHFAEEITEILKEVQEDLALDQRSAESSPNTTNFV